MDITSSALNVDWLIKPKLAIKRYPVLAIGAHPDDVELFIGGILSQLSEKHVPIAIIDLSQGEAGSRGSPQIRRTEALKASASLLPNICRANMQFPDGEIDDNPKTRQSLVAMIRLLKPKIVFAHHEQDLHPDHQAASRLSQKAVYLSRLGNFAPDCGEKHITARTFTFPGQAPVSPALVVNVSKQWQARQNMISAYKSQFDPNYADQSVSKISHPQFRAAITAQATVWGASVGHQYGEALCCPGTYPSFESATQLIPQSDGIFFENNKSLDIS